MDSFGTNTNPKRKTKVLRSAVENFLDECENRMVNRPEEDISDDNLEEKMIAKEARCHFKADVRRFLSNLVNFSLFLKKNPPNTRKDVARKFLNNMNGWLYRRKLNQKKVRSEYHQYLWEGILFPFSPEGFVSSTLVRLLVDPR